MDTLTKLEKDKEALELAYNNKNRFDVHKSGSNWIVFDKHNHEECYTFGDDFYFATLMLDYSDFSEK